MTQDNAICKHCKMNECQHSPVRKVCPRGEGRHTYEPDIFVPIAPTADFKELLDRLIAIASVWRAIQNGESLLRASRKAVEDYVVNLEAIIVAGMFHGEAP